ncbi:hypothetical protein ES703_98244 [subsurface metagenome]
MFIVERTAYPQEGVGKPDYSREISVGQERAGVYLGYNQRIRLFSGNWHITDPADYPTILDTGIAVGASEHLIDSDTLMPLPAILPVGYSLTIIAMGFATNQDVFFQAYFEMLGVWTAYNMGLGTGGAGVYHNKLKDLSTTWFDPGADLTHNFDIKVYNQGGGVLYGGAGIWSIVEAVGTPPWPTTKICRCPYCGHHQEAKVIETKITCDSCGKSYLVTNFSSGAKGIK